MPKYIKTKLSPREHVHEAIRQGNGKKIASYMSRYFALQGEKKTEMIKTAKKRLQDIAKN